MDCSSVLVMMFTVAVVFCLMNFVRFAFTLSRLHFGDQQRRANKGSRREEHDELFHKCVNTDI
jgi:hypothetical protein